MVRRDCSSVIRESGMVREPPERVALRVRQLGRPPGRSLCRRTRRQSRNTVQSSSSVVRVKWPLVITSRRSASTAPTDASAGASIRTRSPAPFVAGEVVDARRAPSASCSGP